MNDDPQKIEHLIILMMENRSFDHYLGALSLPPENRTDVEGHVAPPRAITDLAGNSISAWEMDGIYRGYGDPPHGWDLQHANWNGGANDGFVREYEKQFGEHPSSPNDAPNIPMGYYTRQTLPVLYALADQFTVCDHWHSSVLSSTWPNRKYLHSGTRDEDNDTQLVPGFLGFQTTPLYDLLEDVLNPVTGNALTWKSYFSDLPFLAFWYKFAAFHALHNFAGIDTFVSDCRENRLPTVSILDPPFTLADDHPSHDVRLGQKFIGLIVDALTHSESWKNSALVILYDENGAFYDHVAPPPSFEVQEGGPPDKDTPLGFRVPALVISPYSRRRFVSRTTYDHTSILKSIQTRWNVPFDPATFGTRFLSAPSIWEDCFDFNQPPLPIGTYTPVPGAFADLSWDEGVHETFAGPVGGVEAFLERLFILPALKGLDLRAQVFDRLNSLERGIVTLKHLAPL